MTNLCSFKEQSLCNLVKQQEKTLQEHTSRQGGTTAGRGQKAWGQAADHDLHGESELQPGGRKETDKHVGILAKGETEKGRQSDAQEEDSRKAGRWAE